MPSFILDGSSIVQANRSAHCTLAITNSPLTDCLSVCLLCTPLSQESSLAADMPRKHPVSIVLQNLWLVYMCKATLLLNLNVTKMDVSWDRVGWAMSAHPNPSLEYFEMGPGRLAAPIWVI